MKNISVLIIGLSFFFFSLTGTGHPKDDNPTGTPGQSSGATIINILSSPQLNSLANSWAIEYGRLNPPIKVNVNELGNGQTIVPGQLSLVTNEAAGTEYQDQQWKMVVGRDAIVGIFNANNPMLNEINIQGITADKLALMMADPAKKNWNSLIDKGQNAPVNYFTIASEKINENIAAFAGLTASSINGIAVATAAEIISSVQKDKYAIGFCKLTDVRTEGSNNLVQGIKLLPIDKNKNGRMDSFENIYSSIDTFTRGVWIGKYPRALCGNIYAVSATRPNDQNTLAFLSWITTQGQKFLNTNGYSDLASAEIKSNIAALSGNLSEDITNTTPAKDSQPFISSIWMVALLFFALSALLYIAVLRVGRKQKWSTINPEANSTPVLNEDAILAPKGLFFDKTHTWAFMEQDGNVKVGIDDFLQHVTGTLSRIILKNKGEKVRKGEKILTVIREGKQLNIYAPISGTIIQHNTSLLSDSTLINTSPYSQGWVYVIEPNNWAREMRFLFMGEKYKEWIEDEISRLKDFFAVAARSKTPAFSQVILQDGGELADNILANLEPEVWEDFQIKFINTSK